MDVVQVAAGDYHTVGLRSDGTVVAVGQDADGSVTGVATWVDILRVAAGKYHTVGLRSDGTVVAAGNNDLGQCNVGGWTDIVQITAGGHETAGLKSDGTVVRGRGYDVHFEEDIIHISVGGEVPSGAWVVVVLSDGTVEHIGVCKYGWCDDIYDWMDIIQAEAGFGHTVGLRSDGTVVVAGWNKYGQCQVGHWTDIVQVSAGWSHTVGLKSDGTVVAASWVAEVAGWNLFQSVP